VTLKTRLACLMAALAVGVALVCGALPAPVSAKSYRITRVDIGARLNADGSMEVSEARTYAFSGSFTFAYRDFPVGQQVTFDDFEVYEGGSPYEASDSESPGTYRVTRSGGRTRVTWYYRANDETRTFGFRYRALDTVEKYDDAAVLYYKFLSEDWDMAQDNVSISLAPPGPIARDEVKEWLHGPLWAESRITEDGAILAQCRRLPPDTYLEIRALYPPRLFPDVDARAGRVRDGIMAEEAAWVEEANRKRVEARERAAARAERGRIGKWYTIVLALAGLGSWWQLYRAYGRRPPLPLFLDMSSDIPGKTPPALVAYLLNNGQVSGPGLVATMLDLARRGFVDLREEEVEKKRFWGGTGLESEYYWDIKRAYYEGHASELKDYERDLLEFIFGRLAGGADSIALADIKKKRREFIKFFAKWKKGVAALGEKQGWFDRTSLRGSYYSLALGGAMVLVAIGSAFFFGEWALVPGVTGVVVMVLSFLIYHRTGEGETEARHWMALRKYLKTYEFKSENRRDLLGRLSDYLVYGAVLGLSTRFYREIAALIPETEHVAYVPWYIYHGSGARAFSPAAFGEAFSSMVATTSSAMSTASGTGGGASGGGGGGAGSGGGGAG
jgi:uncharacterized membrane protein